MFLNELCSIAELAFTKFTLSLREITLPKVTCLANCSGVQLRAPFSGACFSILSIS